MLASLERVQGNLFAKVVFWLWPAVVVATFYLRRGRESPARTALWTMLLGSMFLPFGVEFDPPILPGFNKLSWNAAWTWGCLLAFHRPVLAAPAPGHNTFRIILALDVLAMVATVFTNTDALYYGPRTVQGHSLIDVVSVCLQIYFDTYIPFAIGQRLFRSEQDLRDLCATFARALLLYTPFMLYEVRMAPVLHQKLYGVAPFAFDQALRGGGYRVSVFMPHGLMLAMFTFAGLFLARALHRGGVPMGPLSARTTYWLGLGLLVGACRTLAAFLYSGVTWLVTFRVPSPKKLGAVLVFLSVVVGAYPLTRGNGSFPTDKLIEWAQLAGEDRAGSLIFRFDNEDILLAHANQRPYFGWGAFGRNRVFNEVGEDVSITDGTWIIVLGTRGYIGFALEFAFVILPLLRAAYWYGRVRARARPLLAALAMVSACLAVDLLPNARQDNWTLILGGALWSLAEALTRRTSDTASDAESGSASV